MSPRRPAIGLVLLFVMAAVMIIMTSDRSDAKEAGPVNWRMRPGTSICVQDSTNGTVPVAKSIRLWNKAQARFRLRYSLDCSPWTRKIDVTTYGPGYDDTALGLTSWYDLECNGNCYAASGWIKIMTGEPVGWQRKMDECELLHVMGHELGHQMGLDHDPNHPRSLMYTADATYWESQCGKPVPRDVRLVNRMG